MKIIISLFILYVSICFRIDERCKENLGWRFYSIYPEPMCYVMDNVAPLRILEKPKYNPSSIEVEEYDL